MNSPNSAGIKFYNPANTLNALQTQLIKYKNSIINVSTYGKGAKYLFCFHGFGENGNSFQILENALGHIYTLIALDFPFHGATAWKDKLLMTPEDLINILPLLIKDNELIKKPFKFSILAYSLGGRAALHLLQKIPEQIEKVVLLAPDGLKVNFWYWLGTQTIVGNKLFFSTMENPSWFFKLIYIGKRAGLLNKTLIKWVHYYQNDKTERALLYKRWTTMRRFKPCLISIKKIIIETEIPVSFLLGSRDSIILSRWITFWKKDNPNIKISIVPSGHEVLKEKFVPSIASLFSQ